MAFSKALFPALLAVCGVFIASHAQTVIEKCGTVSYEKELKQKNSKRESLEQFEQWMKTRKGLLRSNKSSDRTTTQHYVIPVIVHVIHNGEIIGNGTNISDAQIQSQIDVLNADYPRLNADAVNTPAEFSGVAGAIDMEFVLAKQDPEGLPTNGILRVKGGKTSWTMADNNTFKALSYWPAENYLNIWVLKLNDPSGVIGYAQLPVSDQLQGLEDSSNDALTDGVAIDYRAFGTGSQFTSLYNQFDKGRTATHEIGHIFGLRHIWGDVTNSCSGTDYCDDTPTQDNATSNCPSQPAVSCTPPHDKMFQNYMDYTDDACMNLFTQDQIDRMVVVLGSSPRRASLLVSPGATDPVVLPYDLGIKAIVSPKSTSCPSVTPSIVIRNYGSNVLTEAVLKVTVNGSFSESIDVNFNLNHLDSTVVQFSTIPDLPFASTNQFEFHIESITPGSDGKAANDTLYQTVSIPYLANLPLLESFNSLPASWTVINPDGLITWRNAIAPNGVDNNKAMMMDFYDYEAVGESDNLVSPVFDFSTDTAAILKFDRSYASLSSSYSDRLRILVSTDCDFSHAVEIFNKAGSALATAASTSTAYVPAGASDWTTESISLSQFLGQSHVQIAFVATNDYGNNLYLDNVRVITGIYTDLVLSQVKSPSPVTCEDNPVPVITITNNGSNLATDFEIDTQINGNAIIHQTFTGYHIDTGEAVDLTLDPWPLINGLNTVNVTVINPNEVNPNDNSMGLNVVVSYAKEQVPMSQDFNSTYTDWQIVSQIQQSEWASTSTNKSTSIFYDGYNNAAIGNKSWLVSPTLDFGTTGKSSLFFDLSYAKSSTGNERLQVLLSDDCGLTFPTVIFDKTGDQFADTVSGASWKPKKDDDWKRYSINLSPLLGKDKGRIAFLVTNGHGNNVYIDNIEVYAQSENSWYAVYNNYLPTFKITFNMPTDGLVHMQVLNMLGQVVMDSMLPASVPNQTYDIDLSDQQSGIYIVRLQAGPLMGTARVMVPK